jgi:hypothetical protein
MVRRPARNGPEWSGWEWSVTRKGKEWPGMEWAGMECHPESGMAGNGMAGNGMSQGWARNRMVRRRVRHEVSLRRTWQGRKRRPRGIEELLEQNRFGWVCHSKRPSRDKGVVRVVSGEFVARCETTRGDSSSGGPGCSRVCRRVGKRSERHGRERPPVSKGWGWWGTSHDAYREGLSIGQARTGEGSRRAQNGLAR